MILKCVILKNVILSTCDISVCDKDVGHQLLHSFDNLIAFLLIFYSNVFSNSLFISFVAQFAEVFLFFFSKNELDYLLEFQIYEHHNIFD